MRSELYESQMQRRTFIALVGAGVAALHPVTGHAQQPERVRQSIETFARAPNGGLIPVASAAGVRHRDLIITLAARHKLPAVYWERLFITAGGLISYGPDLVDQFQRAAGYVD